MYTEKRILASVDIKPNMGVNVTWENVVMKNGNVIASENERCAFSKYQRNAFLYAVPDGLLYADAAGLEPEENRPKEENDEQ